MPHLADSIATLHQAPTAAPACTGRTCALADQCAGYAAWMAGERRNVQAPCVVRVGSRIDHPRFITKDQA